MLRKTRKKERDPSARCARSGLASLSDARFQNGKKPMPPPVFSERVRKRLKEKSLEGKMLCTENGSVRKSMSRKGLDREREYGSDSQGVMLSGRSFPAGPESSIGSSARADSLRTRILGQMRREVPRHCVPRDSQPRRLLDCQRADAPGRPEAGIPANA